MNNDSIHRKAQLLEEENDRLRRTVREQKEQIEQMKELMVSLHDRLSKYSIAEATKAKVPK